MPVQMQGLDDFGAAGESCKIASASACRGGKIIFGSRTGNAQACTAEQCGIFQGLQRAINIALVKQSRFPPLTVDGIIGQNTLKGAQAAWDFTGASIVPSAPRRPENVKMLVGNIAMYSLLFSRTDRKPVDTTPAGVRGSVLSPGNAVEGGTRAIPLPPVVVDTGGKAPRQTSATGPIKPFSTAGRLAMAGILGVGTFLFLKDDKGKKKAKAKRRRPARRRRRR